MPHLRAKQGHSHPFSTAPPFFLSIHLLVPTHYPNSPWRLVSFSQQSSGPGAQALLHRSLLALTTHATHPHFTSAHLTGTLPSPDLPPFLEVEAQVPKFTWPICAQLCLLLHARMFLDLLPLNPPLFHVHCHHLMAWPYSLASHKPKILSFSYPFATHYICLEDFQMKNDSNTCHLCSFMLSAAGEYHSSGQWPAPGLQGNFLCPPCSVHAINPEWLWQHSSFFPSHPRTYSPSSLPLLKNNQTGTAGCLSGLDTCLWLRSWSWGPGIRPQVQLPAQWGVCVFFFPLPWPPRSCTLSHTVSNK